MIVGEDGGRVLVKLQKGEEFLPSLVTALEDAGVKSGLVLGGIGALQEFELGWFDPVKKEYVRQRFRESHELLTVQGTVSLEGDPKLHLHCSLANSRFGVVGGHLFGGVVSVLAEVSIQSFANLRLSREVNPKTGLKELTMKRVRSPG